MGIFHRLEQLLQRSYLNKDYRRENRRGVSREWRAWAFDHGFDFREEDPSLVGRWFAPFDKGVEAYRDVLSGTVRGIDMIAFVRDRVWSETAKQDYFDETRTAYLIAKLPRPPSETVLDRGADHTIAAFGVQMRDNYAAEFLGPDWLAFRRIGSHDPNRLALAADMLARLIIDAPPTVWSHA